METNKAKAFISFFLLFSLSISSSCSAFNITKLLEKEDDFSNFNNYLSQTKLADQINKRSTITVLAVSNSAIGGLGGDDFVLKSIMSVHVILDYYDKDKLSKLAKNNKSATLTTLFQTSGVAKDQQGFIRVGANDNGEISFGSASKGSQMNSKVVKSVTAQPYNISVLQVSSIIEVPNINASPSPERAPATKPKSKDDDDDKADSPSDDTADSPADDSNSDGEAEKAPSPSKEKHNSPPKPDEADDTVTSDSPSSTPSPSPSSTPAPAPSKSYAHATAGGMSTTVGVVMGLVLVLVAYF